MFSKFNGKLICRVKSRFCIRQNYYFSTREGDFWKTVKSTVVEGSTGKISPIPARLDDNVKRTKPSSALEFQLNPDEAANMRVAREIKRLLKVNHSPIVFVLVFL